MEDSAIRNPFLGILETVEPKNRRKIARAISREVRAKQSDRILANVDSEGSAYPPRRKSTRRRVKKRPAKMFQKLGRRSRLRMRSNANVAAVEINPKDALIARTHHYGLKERIGRKQVHRFEKRPLLGFGKEEEKLIGDLVLKSIAEGFK